MLKVLALALAGFALSSFSAAAQQARAAVSQCQAIAGAVPGVTFASFSGGASFGRSAGFGRGAGFGGDAGFRPGAEPAAVAPGGDEVKITFVGHSTFLIEGPDGVSVATDYSGWYPVSPAPTVATMNRAHSSHYTLTPDPAIRHVLHGWSDTPGEKAEHHLVVGDTYIRNVTTDLRLFRGWGGDFGGDSSVSMEADQNSIFIYEMAGLCIGHLGHLHHELTDTHYAEIGRLDVLMVPVDGGLTMGADSMSRVVQRLRSALILPMHRPGNPRDRFIEMFDGRFDVSFSTEDSITVSMRSLPKKPLIYVMKGM